MNLEINTWKHSVFPSNARLGVAASVASPSPESNVGHVGLVLRTNETETPNLDQFAIDHCYLDPKEGFAYIREKNANKKFIEKNQEWLAVEMLRHPEINFVTGEYVVSKYSAREVRALEFHHSFWPDGTPSNLQMAKGFFHIGRGIKPAFRNLQSDMIQESKEVMINNHMTAPRIEHPVERAQNIPNELEVLKNKKSVIKEKNDRLKVDRINLSLEIESLEKKQSTLSLDIKDLQDKIASYQKDVESLQTQVSVLKGGFARLSQFELNVTQSLIRTLNGQLSELSRQDDQLNDEWLIKNSFYLALTEEIKEGNSELDSLTKQIARLETKLASSNMTVGRNPDYSITISTSKEENFLDMNAILKEMENQRRFARFSLLNQNCAVSVKKCLLAGITDDFKRKLRDDGVSKDFFKLSFFETETPISVAKWANKLNGYMMKARLEAREEVCNQSYPTL